MQKYLSHANTFGFSTAMMLTDLSVECQAEIRSYCNPEQCPNYGQNWVCPPGCGTLEECQEKTRIFHQGILLQSISTLAPPVRPETYYQLNREHNVRFKEFIQTIDPETVILPLTSGGCVFCDLCTYPQPCIKPKVKMESLSAFGINVGDLCRGAGLPFAFREDVVYFTALLLIK